MKDERIITPKLLERMMALCLECSRRNAVRGRRLKLFITDCCEDCFEWQRLKRVKSEGKK